METEAAVVLTAIGVLVVLLGFFFFGVCGLFVTAILMVVVIAYSAETREPTLRHTPFRYACP